MIDRQGIVPVVEVRWDPTIYPRAKWSTATIDRYADALVGGEQFPPLALEVGTDRLLDGKHRLEAHKKAGIVDVPVEWHRVPDGVPVKLYAASLSARHGDRLSGADTKTLCRELYTENPEWKQKDVARWLAVSEGTVSGHVSDILAKRREERRAKALRLQRLGWEVDDIALALGVAPRTVDGDLAERKNFSAELLASGHTPEDIALRLGLPVQVVLALQLDGQDDNVRLDRLGIKLQPYDVWQFPGCHDLMGDTHPGRIPGELLCHVLYFFTQPGDLVVDPMAGSGTTLDACLLMGRKARGYDIDLHHDRIDVERWDLNDGWPDTVEKAALIFWDPPYFAKKDSEYVDGSISRLNRDEYLDVFVKTLSEAHKRVQPGTRLAFLMSDWDGEHWEGKRGADETIFIWDYAGIVEEAGWQLRRHIQVPLSTQQVHPDIVNKFRESRRLARLERYLLVAEA